MTNQTIQDITEAVLDASSIMLEAEHITEATHSKSGHANFVTEYDTRVQKELFDRLGKILPEASFMGEEESSWSYSDKGYQFIIDPIDGTTNFIKKNHTSCISVGLLKDGEPLLGMVYNPYRDELFYAKKGEGAYLNQKPIRVSAEPLENSGNQLLTPPGTISKKLSICAEAAPPLSISVTLPAAGRNFSLN